MNVKNTFLVCANNFMLVWKQLVYSIIILGVVGLSLLGLLKPVVNLLEAQDWFIELGEFIELIYTHPSEIATGFSNIARSFYNIVVENFSTLWGNYIFSIFLIVFVPVFAKGISNYVMGDLVNSKMRSWASYSWVQRLISTLKRSVIYSLMLMIFWLPFIVLIILSLMGYGLVATSFLRATLFLPVLVLTIIILTAIKGVFGLWLMPICVNEDCNTFKAFRQSVALGGKKFVKTFLALFTLYITEFFAVTLIGLFTLGTGLLIILPAIPVLNSAFALICYYQENKLRYYINENTIVNPL